jgi:Fic family protein
MRTFLNKRILMFYMNMDKFTNPSGDFVKNDEGHYTFVPHELPVDISYDNKLVSILSEADKSLGKLSGIGQLLPNPHILIHPYIRREAILSSRIEGTMASLSDLFLYEITKKEPKEYMRIREVRNYVRATEKAYASVRRGNKITLEMIKRIHRTLLYKVRGSERYPGDFRRIQNWLGPPDSNIKEAVFVPPSKRELKRLLNNFEDFIENPLDDVPLIIQCGLMHYQFETIHPFLDGNGRIGRLLITLYMCDKKLLSQPLLYLSAYLNRNKDEYCDKLMAAREKSDYEGWLKFFLNAVAFQSKEAITNVEKILLLQRKYQDILRKIKCPMSVRRLTEYLFLNPYTTAQNAALYLKVSFPTAQNAIKTLEREGILEEYSKQKRNRIFVAKELIQILDPHSD